MLLDKVTEIAHDVYLRLNLHNKNPMGLCAIASTFFFEAITDAGFKADIHRIQGGLNWGHCFVIVKIDTEWYTVDLTFQQFDGGAPAVLIERYSDYKKRISNCPDTSGTYTERWTSDINHFKRYFIAGWIKSQKPQHYKIAA